MARTDESIKKLLKNKENFADLFNATIFRGKQVILPVLSVVFYYGEKEWDAGTCIHDLIKWPEDSELKDIIPNYKMNLIWVYGIEDIDKFTTDLQYILYLLRYKQDEMQLKDYINKNDEKLKHMGQDSQNAVIALMGNNVLQDVKKEEGAIQMGSKALDAIHERGIKQGQALSQIALMQRKIKRGDSLSKIAEDLLEDEQDVENLYKLIKEHAEATEEEIYKMITR